MADIHERDPLREWHQVALVSGAQQPSRVRVISIAPLTLTARIQERVDATLRLVANDLVSEGMADDWMEAACRVDDSAQLVRTVPGIVLMDGRAAVIVVLFEAFATLLISTDLDSMFARFRFKRVVSLSTALSQRGYSKMVGSVQDWDENVEDALPALFERLLEVARESRRARIRSDSWIWFVALSLFVGICFALSNSRTPVRSPIVLAAAAAVVGLFGGVAFTAVAYAEERHLLRERIRRMRDSWADRYATTAPTRFTVERNWQSFGLGVVVLAAFTSLAAYERGWLEFGVIGGALATLCVKQFLSCHADIIVDTEDIEGLGLRGRIRIPFASISEIERHRLTHMFWVRAADGHAIWIPSTVVSLEQLFEILYDRQRLESDSTFLS
jgi:hypothetical protein